MDAVSPSPPSATAAPGPTPGDAAATPKPQPPTADPETATARPTPVTPERMPAPIGSTQVLQLNEEAESHYSALLANLEKRARKQTRISYGFLAAMFLVAVFTIYIIAEARTVLGGDLEKARRNVELDQELNNQRSVLAQEEATENKRIDELKADLLKQLGGERAWLPATLPGGFTSHLHWVDLRGETGFAIGARILYTTDQGQHWDLATVESLVPGELFVPTAAFASGGYGQKYFGWTTGKKGKIARSSDGGKTWRIVTARYTGGDRELDPGEDARADFNYVFFKDTKVGWAVGDSGLIARSEDGGESWIVAGDGVSKANLYFARCYTDEACVAIGTDRTIVVSLDAGVTWKAAAVPTAGGSDLNFNLLSMDLQLPDSYTAFGRVIVGGSRGIILLGDRGQDSLQWSFAQLVEEKTGQTRPLRGDIAEIGSLRWIERLGATDNVIAVGDNGTILASTNLGKTWKPLLAAPAIDSGVAIRFAQAISANKAVIIGGSNLVAQVELGLSPQLTKISRDSTPATGADWRWLSPSGQSTQVLVGVGGAMHLVNFGKALAPFRESEKDDFRRIVVNPALQKAALEAFPPNSYLAQALNTIISGVSRSNEELEKIRKRKDLVDQRREKNLNLQEISSQEFMLWLNGARVLVILIAFFLIRFLSTIYHYHLGLSAFYEARADALRMLQVLPGTMADLAATFSPKPLEETVSGGMLGDLANVAKGLLGQKG